MSNGKTSGLAIASLVLGIIGLCSIITAPIGLIVGIIALTKISGSEGQIGGKGLALAGTITSGIATAMIPIYAAIAIPNFIRYQLRAKSSEARVSLLSIKTGAEAYHAEHDAYPTGDTGWVPAQPCNPKCTVDARLWSGAPWTDLEFAPSFDHYYQYRYTSDGSTFTIEAQADLDHDGTPGLYRTTGESIEDVSPGEF